MEWDGSSLLVEGRRHVQDKQYGHPRSRFHSSEVIILMSITMTVVVKGVILDKMADGENDCNAYIEARRSGLVRLEGYGFETRTARTPRPDYFFPAPDYHRGRSRNSFAGAQSARIFASEWMEEISTPSTLMRSISSREGFF